jgi:tRNA threonylcarbamoyladenosine biosynthesis protein TsaB
LLLLATDTSGKHGSIALAECGPQDECMVLEVVPLTGGTFSAQLVPQIAALLEKHGFSKRDIGAFATASGPGSFTGLRVGLAAIKALAEVLEKPIAAVSLLEVIAESSHSRGKVLAVLDAGRNELYVGEYEIGGSETHLISETLMEREQCFNSSRGWTIVTPDPGVAEAARLLRVKVEEVERPRSDAIARIGWRKIRAGQTVSPEELEANYIRRSDAEIFARSSPG